MADTLLLDRDQWDLTLDAAGNIAVASEPYSTLQDVASACRLFAGELYYDTTKGVPYFQEVLGRYHPTQFLKSRLIAAAQAVPGVRSARCYLTALEERRIGGQIQVETDQGEFTVQL